MADYGIRIAGTGAYAPERVLTNEDLERMVDTSDEWITTRTGIKERRIAADDESTSDMAAKAAARALEAAGIGPHDVDMILVATFSPDHLFPNTACRVQEKLGAEGCACFDLEAACSGFLYGFGAVGAMIRTGMCRRALVIGAEKISTHVDWTDRATCVLFGDGAGAVVLEQTSPEDDRFLACSLGADGRYGDLLIIPAGGTAIPITRERLEQRLNTIHMQGREAFKLAVGAMVGAARDAVAKAGIDIADVRWLIPHQANTRIINAVGQRLGIPSERVYVNIDRYGNTSAASIPLALDEIARNGLVQPGENLVMVAFGSGLTWGAVAVRW